MCIRDRPHADDQRTLAGGRRGDGPAHVERVPAREQRVDLCLLYTSDAADERSSVDLGGRRIIKKKQSNRHIGKATHYTKTTSTRGG